jgi:hypothetical protein
VIAYKFLRRGGLGLLTTVKWPLPTSAAAGPWLEIEGPLEPCRRGLHACRLDDLAHWIAEELWEVELDREWMVGPDCLVARRARLTRPITAWNAATAHKFGVACVDRASAHLAQSKVPPAHAGFRYVEQAYQFTQSAHAAFAAYAAALACVAATDSDPVTTYRNERRAQAELLARELGLVQT